MDTNIQDDMNDWWAEHKRQEEEIQQLELKLTTIREEIARMKVTRQDGFTLSDGTCLQGYVKADFNELVETFGEPLEGDGYKTQAEWVLLFSLPDGDEVIATIYDWKKDCSIYEVEEWNIGGHDPRAPELVIDYLNYARDMEERQVTVWNENVHGKIA
jgi:hypothetical protein